MSADRDLLLHAKKTTESRFLALPRPVKRVLVLCLGNICRSPFAEHCLRRMAAERGIQNLTIQSAGFLHHDGLKTPTRFVELVRPHGVDLSAHRAQRVSQQQVDEADLILLMDAKNLRALQSEFPHATDRTLILAKSG